MIRVLIVDDNAEVRAALKRIIEKTTDIAIGGEAANGQEALDKIEEQERGVVLLDVSLPDLSGLEVLKRIKSQRPELRVLMVSVHPEELYAAPALRTGASGYLTKDRAAEQLAIAIRKVATGCLYFSPTIAEQLGVEIADGLAGPPTTGTLRKANSDS
jgi:DNA-binding NarL/FixJ family response regulator